MSTIIVMAFDFGEARIGIAVGNTMLKIPHPLATVTGQNKFEKFDKIAELCVKWKPSQFVVGMPTVTPDKELFIKSVQKFANRLRQRFSISVEFINEDYTSSMAISQLNEQAVYGIKQKSKLDQLAACNILQTYFDRINKNT